ncbi:hypothetical protein NA56DRAFT_152094 [Hyaloscypha hepaticicola]|uniref:Uncharacterized protein n=1 Tax=Hyaloscypha hepaticicola TaxID=2082293 RepID=A0A2J6QNV6_9HELO|nr:hypothetical protein NA56DRAFT_152094 [Hyaloscypha hepaticicola]
MVVPSQPAEKQYQSLSTIHLAAGCGGGFRWSSLAIEGRSMSTHGLTNNNASTLSESSAMMERRR